MTLVFYAVGNSQKFGRHTFDDICDKPEEIKKQLSLLNEDEVRCYDISNYGCGTPFLNLADFENDYNNEILDGGWWCIVIP